MFGCACSNAMQLQYCVCATDGAIPYIGICVKFILCAANNCCMFNCVCVYIVRYTSAIINLCEA